MGQVIIAGGGRATAPGLPQLGTALNDCTWEEIKAVSDAGLAEDYFAVGDCKAVDINGTVSSLTIDKTYYVFILGINHNESIEGKAIHFGCFKTELNGTDVCLIDSGYNQNKTSGTWFNMNNSATNSGGWKSSRMRSVLIPTFKTCLPADLVAVLKTITKYTDNNGGGLDTHVTATEDDIFLLAEWEVFGVRQYANTLEQNYQMQYDYYKSGNSKIKYQHNKTTTAAIWWLRSASTVASFSGERFAYVDNGIVSYNYAYNPLGFAPAFAV